MDELYRQLGAMRQQIEDLYQRAGTGPRQQIERLAAAFLSLSKSWEQLYKVQGKQLETAIAELSEMWQLLHVAYDRLQEQEEALMLAHDQLQAQQRRYQEIFELIPNAYLITNAHGIIQEANLQAARLFCRPQQFLLGKPIALFVREQERQTFYQQVNQLIQIKDLPQLYQDWNICLLRLKQEFDATITVAASSEPVSEQVTLHWFLRAVNRSEPSEEPKQILEVVVQHLQESIVITTPELNEPGPQVIFVNPAFTQMTGYTLEEMLGKTPRILQGPNTERTALTRLRQSLEHGQSFRGEATNYHKDGTAYRVDLHCVPIHNQHGHVTHFVSIQSPLMSV